MEQSYIEYFHGNNREIENEKQRKRELMSHFPKTLGTVDETRYVLQDDDKANIWSHYGERNVDHPTLAVISNESEKSKEQKDETTAKTISFDSWKEDSSFLGPKKENRKIAAKSPFDFDGNTAKEENISFNHGIQFPGLGAVGGNQPRTTAERNDSLEVEKDKIENSIDPVCNINDKSNFDLNKNNSSSNSKRKLKVHGKPRTKDYAVQINTLIGNLPVAAADILKQLGVGIDIADNLYTTTDKGEYKKRNGIYLGQNNRIVIDSKHVDEYTLISEVFHAAQDQLEMTGTGKSNLEFHEHVIKDLYFGQKFRKTGDYKYFKGLSATDDEEYANFISNGFDNNGNLYLNNFLMHINSYFDKFQEYYSGSGAYQEPGVDNFSYNWKVILDLFGIKYK